MFNKFLKFKKIIVSFLIVFLLLPFFIRPALAYPGTEGMSYFPEFEEAISAEDMNLQSFVNETLKAVTASLVHNIISGTFFGFLNFGEVKEGVSLFPATSMFLATTLAAPPVSGVKYFANLGKKIGIIKPVYAEEKTDGAFVLFEKIIPIWTAFRNITYLLFVLILIGMGFAIMFRLKISPQAVITIQSALPRIVIGLLLITFSLAIAGLILDVIGFIQRLIVNIFLGDGGIFYKIEGRGIGEFLSAIKGLAGKNFSSSPIALAIGQSIILFTSAFAILIITFMFGPLGILLGLIISILVFIALLRVLWTALKAYAMIVINVIFAPFQILVGILPGSTSFTDWFKNLIANAAVFPVITAMWMVASYLTLQGASALFTGANLAQMITAGATGGLGLIVSLPIAGLINPLNIWNFFVAMLLPIIGVFIMLMTPKASEIIQSFITKKPFEYGTAIGQAMGPVVGPVKGVYQTVRGGVEKKYQQDIAEKVVPLVQNLPSRIFGKKAVPTPEKEQEVGKVGKD